MKAEEYYEVANIFMEKQKPKGRNESKLCNRKKNEMNGVRLLLSENGKGLKFINFPFSPTTACGGFPRCRLPKKNRTDWTPFQIVIID